MDQNDGSTDQCVIMKIRQLSERDRACLEKQLDRLLAVELIEKAVDNLL
jgi:hypothetical protein